MKTISFLKSISVLTIFSLSAMFLSNCGNKSSKDSEDRSSLLRAGVVDEFVFDEETGTCINEIYEEGLNSEKIGQCSDLVNYQASEGEELNSIDLSGSNVSGADLTETGIDADKLIEEEITFDENTILSDGQFVNMSEIENLRKEKCQKWINKKNTKAPGIIRKVSSCLARYTGV